MLLLPPEFEVDRAPLCNSGTLSFEPRCFGCVSDRDKTCI